MIVHRLLQEMMNVIQAFSQILRNLEKGSTVCNRFKLAWLKFRFCVLHVCVQRFTLNVYEQLQYKRILTEYKSAKECIDCMYIDYDEPLLV